MAREAFVGSEIEDLLRADEGEGAGAGAQQSTEAAGADTAFDVEMLRHIVQVATVRARARIRIRVRVRDRTRC